MNTGKVWALFIGGLPRGFNTQEVKDYFENFGEVLRIERVGKSAKQTNLRLEMANEASHSNILVQENLRFANRQLIVRPYVEGQLLAGVNSDLNDRRVVAKFVPALMTEDAFRSWVVSVAGPVQTIYSYQNAAQANSAKRQKKKKSYSILFQEKQAAKTLVSLKTWRFPGQEIETTFHPFIYTAKSRPQHSEAKKSTTPSFPRHSKKTHQPTTLKHFESADRVQMNLIPSPVILPHKLDHTIKPTRTLYYEIRPQTTCKGQESNPNLLFIRRKHANHFEQRSML